MRTSPFRWRKTRTAKPFRIANHGAASASSAACHGRAIKTLDLADVVAGGDGFSGKRNRGIDPTTGRICHTRSSSLHLMGDHQYHRVEGIPFVDGVFIPDGRQGPVQVDSAGHTCDWFLETCNEGYGPIWAGMPVAWAGPSELGDVDYAASGHSALFLHANKGLTFDLRRDPSREPRLETAAIPRHGRQHRNGDQGGTKQLNLHRFLGHRRRSSTFFATANQRQFRCVCGGGPDPGEGSFSDVGRRR